MGHVRPSAKGNYSFSTASIVRIYREQIFPKLAINGWALKEKASEVDMLVKEVFELKNALAHVESENASYKTRVDNLHETVSKLVEAEADREAQFERLNQYIHESILDAEDSGFEAVKVLSKLPEDYDFIMIPKKVKLEE